MQKLDAFHEGFGVNWCECTCMQYIRGYISHVYANGVYG